jgi:hypothetical protein
MKPPIIVAEGWDLSFYSTIHDAEISIEAVDAQNAVYDVWDSEGRKLEVVANPPSAQIRSGSGEPRPKELVSLLQGHLSALGDKSEARSEDLSLLLAKCVALHRR